MVLTNRLILSMQQGLPVCGSAHAIRDAGVSELLSTVDMDFLLIDMQHGAVGLETLQGMLIGLQPTKLAVLVRPPSNDAPLIGQVLDAGADGVIVPMVNFGADAAAAVDAAKYPPAGVRSWGPRRSARLYGGADAYARDANDNTMVFPQIETREAVANIGEITAVPGITGVFVGPTDLAISLGYPLDNKNPAVTEAIDSVFRHCQSRNVPFGMFSNSAAMAEEWLERGALIVISGGDTGFVAEGAARMAAVFRSCRERLAAARGGK